MTAACTVPAAAGAGSATARSPATAPHRVQRFRCVHCGHTFSQQTFSNTYWLRRLDVFERIAHRLLGCSDLRQIVREAKCHHTTVIRHSRRLGRLALIYLWLHRTRGPLTGAIVIDGFESFACGQYRPRYLNRVVGADSPYCSALTFNPTDGEGTEAIEQTVNVVGPSVGLSFGIP